MYNGIELTIQCFFIEGCHKLSSTWLARGLVNELLYLV